MLNVKQKVVDLETLCERLIGNVTAKGLSKLIRMVLTSIILGMIMVYQQSLMKKIACKSYRKKLLKAFERYRENAMNGASRLIDKDMV